MLGLHHFIIALALLLQAARASGQTPPGWELTRLTTDEGLSDNNVSHVFRDRRGFAWIATQYGVNRYDGYEFRTFTYNPSDTNSLSANWVFFTFEDREGYLWMGTYGGGVCRFDPRTEKFTRFRAADRPGALNSDHVSCALQDSDGTIWFGTTSGGLNRFDPRSGQFTALPAPDDWYARATGKIPNPPDTTFAGPPCPHVICLLPENENVFWVGTFAGLARFDKRSGRFTHFFHEPADPNSLPENFIAGLYRATSGQIWIETRVGWAVFRPERGDFERFPSNPALPAGLGSGVKCKDADGAWWEATPYGVAVWRPARNPFALGRGTRYPAEAFDFKRCRTLLEAGGWLWIASETGLFRARLDDPAARLERFLPQNFYALRPGPDSTLWATSGTEGLFQINWSDGATRHFTGTPGVQRPTGSEVLAVVPDAWGHWWIGGQRTLDRYDPRTERFESFLSEGNPTGQTPSDSYIFCLVFDQKRGLWLGASKGGLNLLTFDRNGQPVHFQNFVHDPNDPASLSSNIILSLHRDRRGRLWIGTDGGLNCLDADWQPGSPPRFRRYLRTDGLGDDKIMTIRDDAQGRIWVSLLSHGLACLDGDSIRHYSRSDGLPSQSFYMAAAWERPDGALLYGTTGGLVVFHPDSLQPANLRPPPVYFTEIQLFGRTLDIGAGPGFLPESPVFSPELEFRHDQNQLTFRFAALNFDHPEQNRYAYRLEPLDAAWHDLGTRREVTFSSLPPGRYVLRVKACNNAGIWNEPGATLAFRIRPTWWQTAWAYLFYGLGIAAAGWALFRFQLRRQLDRREAGRLRELDALKTRLFANITHEFRTPLTLILGPVKKLRQAFDKPFFAKEKPPAEALEMVERNAERLLALVNQLLDLNKLEAGMLKPQWTRCALAAVLDDIVALFRPTADAAGITLTLDAPDETLDCDRDKLLNILGNLLANALKATPPGGRVEVRATRDDDRLVVTVADSGPGIAPEHLPRLFERFYRVDESGGEPGTGIGLALARELATLLGGTLEAASEPGRGAVFTFTMPWRQTAATGENFAEKIDPQFVVPSPPGRELPKTGGPEALPLALVVEDNADMRRYLADCLGGEFRLDLAADGRAGWEKALARVPDLVVSDVMMPGMDGYELCRRIKADFRTSHVPVILLTAKTDLPARLEGYAQGADAYLAKPFHEPELLAQARNLIVLRRLLWEKFQSAGRFSDLAAAPQASDAGLPAGEAGFWKKLHDLLAERLDDEHFSVEKMAHALAMSRTQLHRKVLALAGVSAGRLLQNLRLERARQLLATTSLNVGEVAFRCGFSDPNYFTRLFVRTQGCTPTEFKSLPGSQA